MKAHCLSFMLKVAMMVVLTAFNTCHAAPKLDCTADTVVRAAQYGNIADIEACFTRDERIVDAKDTAGCPISVLASMNGHLDTVKALHRMGASIMSPCQSGLTALDFAVSKNYMELAQFLRDAGISRTTKSHGDPCDASKWFQLVRQGDITETERCLIYGTSIETRDEAGCTAVVTAAINQRTEMLHFLAQRGANLMSSCNSGNNALMIAARQGELEVVKFFQDYGVDMETEMGAHRHTALTYAAENGQLHVARYLHKLDLDLGDGWTGGSIMWAAAVGGHELLKTLLKENREDIEARDEHGHTAVSWAAQGGHLKALIALVEHGASLDVRTHSGWTPLMAAAYAGHDNVVTYLLRHGCDINEKDKAHWTALMWACANGKMDTAKQLLDQGASVEPNELGWTPLLAAAVGGHTDIVSMLQRRGLDFRHKNRQGRTSQDLAHQAGHHELAQQFGRMEHAFQHEAKRHQQHSEL